MTVPSGKIRTMRPPMLPVWLTTVTLPSGFVIVPTGPPGPWIGMRTGFGFVGVARGRDRTARPVARSETNRLPAKTGRALGSIVTTPAATVLGRP